MWIKLLLFLGLAAIAVVGLRAPRGARHTAVRRIMLILFVGLASASVVFPDLWNSAARVLGVGRGTDLILYIFIVAFILSVETSYLRARQLQDDITTLARRLALDEAGDAFVSSPSAPAQTAADEKPGAAAETGSK